MKSANADENTFPTPNPIRVPSTFSRYPVHRLAKNGDVAIDIREKNENGEISVKWEVEHSPGPLAYKLDTLVINRRIEEAARPIPRLIRLGSVRDITEELGLKTHNDKIKKSIHQNASAYIKAKIKYRLVDGTERRLEKGFTRYSVIFTGEELPDGRKADAVYILLNDIYMQVINGAMTRPLDYDYLKSLPPASQRFYEIISFQIYAAIKHDRSRAKLIYSELCRYAPLTRQYDWNVVRPQLARIHAPHKKSGYIAKLEFQDTVDADGNRDWIIFYQPGPKARAEFRAFTKRGGPVTLEVEPFESAPLPQLIAPGSPSPLVSELSGYGITETIARRLVSERGESHIRTQIEILGFYEETKPGKIKELAAWLVTAISSPNGHTAPKGFMSKDDRRKKAEAKEAKAREEAEERRTKQTAEALARKEREMVIDYWNSLDEDQKAAHEAAAKAEATEEELKLIEPGPTKRLGMSILRDKYTRKLLHAQGKLPVGEV